MGRLPKGKGSLGRQPKLTNLEGRAFLRQHEGTRNRRRRTKANSTGYTRSKLHPEKAENLYTAKQ